jgi:hypothetical protein
VEIRSYNDSFLGKQFKLGTPKQFNQRERLLLAGSKKREYPRERLSTFEDRLSISHSLAASQLEANGMRIADILGTVKCGFHELL